MTATDQRVYTRAQLLTTAGRPRRVRRDEPYLIEVPRRQHPDDDSKSTYRITSPCCGVTTTVTEWVVSRLLAGDPDGSFECGKPWWHVRGNPKRGGCRAHYAVRPVSPEPPAEHPTVFELRWTGR
jgi:hypothetical protein